LAPLTVTDLALPWGGFGRRARLAALGASRVQRFEPGPLSGGFIVMGDPEGNEFCLD
jgi:hypothetical protein